MTRPLPPYLEGWPVIGPIADWLNDVCEAIQTEVQYWIRKIWEMLPYEVRSAIEKFKDFARTAWDKFVLLFTNPRKFFQEIFDYLWSLLPEWLRADIIKVENFFAEVYAKLKKFVSDPVGTLMALADEVWNKLPRWLRNTIETVRDVVVNLPSQIISRTGEIKDLIWDKVRGWIETAKDKVSEWGRTLAKDLEAARDRILGAFDGAQNIIGLKLDILPGSWWNAFWRFWTVTFPSGLGTILNMLSPFSLVGLVRTLMGYGRGLSGDYKDRIRRFYEEINRTLRDEARRDPFRAYLTVIERASELIAEIELSTMAIELSVPWKTTGLGGAFGAALAEMTVGNAVGATTGTFFEALLRWPTRWINEAFRGNFPNIQDAAQMYMRGMINLDQLRQVFRWTGFDDEWIDRYIQLISIRLPGWRDLVTFFLRDMAKEEDLKQFLRWTGIPEKYHDAYVKSIYEIPSESALLRMWFKGIISEEELNRLLRARGYDKNTIEWLKKDAWYYPSVQDMITFFVREAIPAVHGETARAKLVGLPKEFYEYARKAGLPPEWVEAYWASHWKLPSIEQVYEMFWRGLRSPYTGRPMILDDVVRFLVEQDIDPRWRENLVEIAYKLPGRIVARWGLEWGIWDEKRFEEFLRAEGLHPDWIPDTILIEKRNVFREHYNAVMSAAKRLYQRGYITKEQFVDVIRRLGFPDEVIQLRAWEADLLQEAELKDDILKAAVQEFREGKIDEQQLRNILSGIIVIPDRLEQIIRLEVARAQRRAVAKPTLETELERLKERERDLSRRLMDLESDLENAKKLMAAEMRIWDEKIQAQQRLLEIEVKPEKKAAIQDKIALLQVQKERARVSHENRIREIEETMRFITSDLEQVRSRISALEQAIRAGGIAS